MNREIERVKERKEMNGREMRDKRRVDRNS